MYYLFFILTKVLISISFWHLVYCQRSEFRIIKAVDCDIPGIKLKPENITINYQNSKSYLSARLSVLDDIKAIRKLHLHVERCNSQGHNCEHFQNIKIERLCQMVSWANQYWAVIVDNIHPRFRCPVKKMTYEIRNATLDFDGITNWYPDMFKYRWRTTCKLFNERETIIGCIILIVDIHECKKQDG